MAGGPLEGFQDDLGRRRWAFWKARVRSRPGVFLAATAAGQAGENLPRGGPRPERVNRVIDLADVEAYRVVDRDVVDRDVVERDGLEADPGADVDGRGGKGGEVAFDAVGGTPLSALPGATSGSTQVPTGGGEKGVLRNVARRLVTGFAFGAVVLGCLWAGSIASLVLVLTVLVGAAGEWFSVLRRAGHRPASAIGLAGTVLAVGGAYFVGPGVLAPVTVAVVVATAAWFLRFAPKTRETTWNFAATLLGFGWVGILGSYATALLGPGIQAGRPGTVYLFGVLMTTAAYDTGAYAAGARFGRRRLAPSISPNKTVEGLVGGSVSALAIGTFLVGSVPPWSLGRGLALGLIVAVAAPVGDLVESMLKRDIGVKDMSSLLPGHGGLLDRIDGMLFVLPLAYYLLVALNGG